MPITAPDSKTLAQTQNPAKSFNASLTKTDYPWLLPDGVADLLSAEAIKQERLRYQLTQILLSYGYTLTSPPMIEYTESLLNHASEDLKRKTFKIIDQLTGRLMGVRADITPQIARIDSHTSDAHRIARYCYAGHVIYTLPKGLFGSRTPLQLGAEIFGTDSLTADIELLDVLYTLLASTDLVKASHIDIGHVAIFARLAQLAGMSEAQAEKLKELYANKALPELEKVCQKLKNSGNALAQDFYTLGAMGNNLEKLTQNLSETAKNDDQIAQALADLTTVVAHLKTRWQCEVSMDVTELGYHYHTGLVFNVYVHDESLPLVRGGRFINPLFQADGASSDDNESNNVRHATGFSCELNRWQTYLENPVKKINFVPFNVAQKVLDDPRHTDFTDLTQTIADLRNNGEVVIVAITENDQPKNITHSLIKMGENWVQQPI